VNHIDLANRVAEKLGISQEDSKQFLFLVICVMFEALITDGIIEIHGFGRMVVHDHPGRKIRNPFKGIMYSKDSIAIYFKPYQRLLEEIQSIPIDPEDPADQPL
jgi:nucleoid DNA-binding protein